MFCKKCGNEIKVGEKYCSKCGQSNEYNRSIKLVSIISSILLVVIVSAIIFVLNTTNNNNNNNNLLEEATASNVVDTNTVTNMQNEQIVEKLQYFINDFNDKYAYNFVPTTEEMNILIDFYKSKNGLVNSSDIEEYILSNYWVIFEDSEEEYIYYDNDNYRSGYNYDDYSQDAKTNYNSNESQNNSASTSTTSQSKTTQSATPVVQEDVNVTLDIDIKGLISKNEIAKDIYDNSRTIWIEVYMTETMYSSKRFEYYNGSQNIPDTLQAEFTLYESSKKRNEPREVTVYITNTATNVKDAVIFQENMTFNESGTYKIK